MSWHERGADFHVHSRYSKDSLSLVCTIEQARRQRGLSYIAVTDHNTIGDAPILLRDRSGLPIIVGEEILTSDENPLGKKIEVAGLFLEVPINPGQSLAETLYLIGTQGGIVVIPHPFEEWRHGAGKEMSLYIVHQCLDREIPVAVEVLNARARSPQYNLQARTFWEQLAPLGVLATAGSDAHRVEEVGRAGVFMKPWRTREEFLESLSEGEIHGSSRGAAYHRVMNRVELLLGRPLRDIREALSLSKDW